MKHSLTWIWASVVIMFGLSFVTHPDLFSPHLLTEKRILITGIQSELGRAIAFQYAGFGARLFLVADYPEGTSDSHERSTRDVADRCLQLGASSAKYLIGDLATESFRARVVKRTAEHLGGLDYYIQHHHTRTQSAPQTVASSFTDDATNRTIGNNSEFVARVDLVTKVLPLLAGSGAGGVGIVSPLFGGKIPTASGRSAHLMAEQGFFPSLRQELHYRRDSAKISVTSVALAFVSTGDDPAYATLSANHSLYDFLVTSPEEAALKVVKSVTVGKKEITFPFLAQAHVAAYKLFPSLYEFVAGHINRLPF